MPHSQESELSMALGRHWSNARAIRIGSMLLGVQIWPVADSVPIVADIDSVPGKTVEQELGLASFVAAGSGGVLP